MGKTKTVTVIWDHQTANTLGTDPDVPYLWSVDTVVTNNETDMVELIRNGELLARFSLGAAETFLVSEG